MQALHQQEPRADTPDAGVGGRARGSQLLLPAAGMGDTGTGGAWAVMAGAAAAGRVGLEGGCSLPAGSQLVLDEAMGAELRSLLATALTRQQGGGGAVAPGAGLSDMLTFLVGSRPASGAPGGDQVAGRQAGLGCGAAATAATAATATAAEPGPGCQGTNSSGIAEGAGAGLCGGAGAMLQGAHRAARTLHASGSGCNRSTTADAPPAAATQQPPQPCSQPLKGQEAGISASENFAGAATGIAMGQEEGGAAALNGTGDGSAADVVRSESMGAPSTTPPCSDSSELPVVVSVVVTAPTSDKCDVDRSGAMGSCGREPAAGCSRDGGAAAGGATQEDTPAAAVASEVQAGPESADVSTRGSAGLGAAPDAPPAVQHVPVSRQRLCSLGNGRGTTTVSMRSGFLAWPGGGLGDVAAAIRAGVTRSEPISFEAGAQLPLGGAAHPGPDDPAAGGLPGTTPKLDMNSIATAVLRVAREARGGAATGVLAGSAGEAALVAGAGVAGGEWGARGRSRPASLPSKPGSLAQSDAPGPSRPFSIKMDDAWGAWGEGQGGEAQERSQGAAPLLNPNVPLAAGTPAGSFGMDDGVMAGARLHTALNQPLQGGQAAAGAYPGTRFACQVGSQGGPEPRPSSGEVLADIFSAVAAAPASLQHQQLPPPGRGSTGDLGCLVGDGRGSFAVCSAVAAHGGSIVSGQLTRPFPAGAAAHGFGGQQGGPARTEPGAYAPAGAAQDPSASAALLSGPGVPPDPLRRAAAARVAAVRDALLGGGSASCVGPQGMHAAPGNLLGGGPQGGMQTGAYAAPPNLLRPLPQVPEHLAGGAGSLNPFGLLNAAPHVPAHVPTPGPGLTDPRLAAGQVSGRQLPLSSAPSCSLVSQPSLGSQGSHPLSYQQQHGRGMGPGVAAGEVHAWGGLSAGAAPLQSMTSLSELRVDMGALELQAGRQQLGFMGAGGPTPWGPPTGVAAHDSGIGGLQGAWGGGAGSVGNGGNGWGLRQQGVQGVGPVGSCTPACCCLHDVGRCAHPPVPRGASCRLRWCSHA